MSAPLPRRKQDERDEAVEINRGSVIPDQYLPLLRPAVRITSSTVILARRFETAVVKGQDLASRFTDADSSCCAVMTAIIKLIHVSSKLSASRLGSLFVEATVGIGAKAVVIYSASPAKGREKGNKCGSNLEVKLAYVKGDTPSLAAYLELHVDEVNP